MEAGATGATGATGPGLTDAAAVNANGGVNQLFGADLGPIVTHATGSDSRSFTTNADFTSCAIVATPNTQAAGGITAQADVTSSTTLVVTTRDGNGPADEAFSLMISCGSVG